MTEDTGKTAVVVKKKEKEKTSEKQTENQTEDQKKEQSGTKTESQSTAQKKEGTETQINPENIQNQNTPAKKVQEQNASTAGNQNSGTVQVQQPENNSSASAEAETTAASNSSPEYTSAENLGLTLTDESVTLYSADGSAATYIYKIHGQLREPPGRKLHWHQQKNSHSKPDPVFPAGSISPSAKSGKKLRQKQDYRRNEIHF